MPAFSLDLLSISLSFRLSIVVGVRTLIAECLGKLTFALPAAADLCIQLISSKSALSRATVAEAIKFMSLKQQAVKDRLADLFALLGDLDLVRWLMDGWMVAFLCFCLLSFLIDGHLMEG